MILRLVLDGSKNEIPGTRGDGEMCKVPLNSGAPVHGKRAWDSAPYSWNMVNLFSLSCHVIDRAYVRTYASTDCTVRVGETIKRKGGVSQAYLGKSSSFIYDTHNMVN